MAEETFGSPPGAHQDPNFPTRSNGEPGMPEISCIASEVDDLRPPAGPSCRGRELPLGFEPVVPVGADGLALASQR